MINGKSNARDNFPKYLEVMGQITKQEVQEGLIKKNMKVAQYRQLK